MDYIITQVDDTGVTDIDSVDAMISEEDEKIQTFPTYEEAAAYLMCHGIRELQSGFPFGIKIERMQ
jgi:hypothetical protein|tara:strand:- start:352 stop:549 length:198 start_codon:yes stop_codon:yes gene_type:complete